jgi:predicted amidohydrolase
LLRQAAGADAGRYFTGLPSGKGNRPVSSEAKPRYLRIAALQPALKPQAATANMVLLRRMVEDLVTVDRLDVVVLPEVFDGCSDPQPGTDPSVDARAFLANLARVCRVNVIGGSVDCPQARGRSRNSCFVVDRQGGELGRYDKRVLFSHEADRRTAGDGPGIFELDGVRVGVLICADLWPPELARELLDKADVLYVPAKTAVPSDLYVRYARTAWHSLTLTRAMENGLAVAVSDWVTDRYEESFEIDGATRRRVYHTCGAASICDPGTRPDSEQLRRVIDPQRSGAVRAEIDLDALAEYRRYRRAVGLLPPG